LVELKAEVRVPGAAGAREPQGEIVGRQARVCEGIGPGPLHFRLVLDVACPEAPGIGVVLLVAANEYEVAFARWVEGGGKLRLRQALPVEHGRAVGRDLIAVAAFEAADAGVGSGRPAREHGESQDYEHGHPDANALRS